MLFLLAGDHLHNLEVNVGETTDDMHLCGHFTVHTNIGGPVAVLCPHNTKGWYVQITYWSWTYVLFAMDNVSRNIGLVHNQKVRKILIFRWANNFRRLWWPVLYVVMNWSAKYIIHDFIYIMSIYYLKVHAKHSILLLVVG